MNVPVQRDLVLAACPVCGNSIVKLEHVHKCVDELKRSERGFQLMGRNMAALIPDVPGGVPGIYDFGRAEGGCVCPKCRLPYREHPIGLEDHLVLLCDGKQVKL